MKSTIVLGAVIVATVVSARSLARRQSVDGEFHVNLLDAIHKRDAAIVRRGTDTYGNHIGISEGCWVPNCM